MSSARSFLLGLIAKHPVLVIGTKACPYTAQCTTQFAKFLPPSDIKVVHLDNDEHVINQENNDKHSLETLRHELHTLTGYPSTPRVFVTGQHYPGLAHDLLSHFARHGRLANLLLQANLLKKPRRAEEYTDKKQS